MNEITWYADLGIEIKLAQDSKEYSSCWRMVPPAPITDWSDPYISPTAAYRAACAQLCHLAWQGRATMDRELIEIRPDGDGTMVYGQARLAKIERVALSIARCGDSSCI